MTSRRDFIKYTVVLGAGLFLTAKLKPSGTAHAQSGPGHSHHGGIRRIATNPALQALVLDPATITKYATQLVIPPAMPKAAKPKGIKGPKNFDYYEISVQQFQQQILPPSQFGPTTVWGYGSAAHPGHHQLPVLHHRGDVQPAGAREVDQRPGGCGTATTCRTCCRWIRRCIGPTRPVARWPRRPQHGPNPLHRSCADGDPRPRRAHHR